MFSKGRFQCGMLIKFAVFQRTGRHFSFDLSFICVIHKQENFEVVLRGKYDFGVVLVKKGVQTFLSTRGKGRRLGGGRELRQMQSACTLDLAVKLESNFTFGKQSHI